MRLLFNSLTVFLLLFFLGCENDLKKVNIVTQKQTLPTLSAKNIEVIYSDSAIIKVRLTAPLSEEYESEDPYTVFPKGIKAVFFKEDLSAKTTLTANYAINKKKKRIMEARGNVIVVNEKGETLNTEHLIWDESTQKVYTNEFVKITTSDKIIFGQGMEADQNFTKYKIFKIKGTVNVNKDA
jgi:LPS export ABC transporter protein LptC